jgi:hypothetical protein
VKARFAETAILGVTSEGVHFAKLLITQNPKKLFQIGFDIKSA